MQSGSFDRQRASKRLRWSLPVLLDCDKTVYTASTEDLSAQGARIKAPVTIPPGALVTVTNLQTGHRVSFRVVWGSEDPGCDDCFRLGVQMTEPDDGFWGFDWHGGAKPLGRPRHTEPLANQTLAWRKH